MKVLFNTMIIDWNCFLLCSLWKCRKSW